MFIFRQSRQLTSYIEFLKTSEKKIAFIPTMGALHAGHLSLIQNAQAKGDFCVCCIFVNPTQFDKESDLKLYPRNTEADITLLESINCDLVFIPSEEEVYPQGQEQYIVDVDLKKYTSVLEGEHRIGHFEGMMQVVNRLLDIVPADRIYMGQKDYQQQAIVSHMLKAVNKKTELVTVPIKREDDGLAMSSRNVRIEKELRSQATLLNKTLLYCKENIENTSIKELTEECISRIESGPFRLEYFTIIDGDTLEELDSTEDSTKIVAVLAAWLGDVRLIDNMIIKG